MKRREFLQGLLASPALMEAARVGPIARAHTAPPTADTPLLAGLPTHGLHGITLLTGRPCNGKSSMAMNLAWETALQTHRAVWYAQMDGAQTLATNTLPTAARLRKTTAGECLVANCKSETVVTAETGAPGAVIHVQSCRVTPDFSLRLDYLLHTCAAFGFELPGLIVVDGFDLRWVHYDTNDWVIRATIESFACTAALGREYGVPVLAIGNLPGVGRLERASQFHMPAATPADYQALEPITRHCDTVLSAIRPSIYEDMALGFDRYISDDPRYRNWTQLRCDRSAGCQDRSGVWDLLYDRATRRFEPAITAANAA